MRSDVGATAREVATDTPFGAAVPRRPWPTADVTPLRALEDAVRPALRRAPCVVSYSGGRDSALLLAVAARLAAREGLEPPVAMTLRFPGVPEAEETAWQELGVAGLQLGDWIRHEPASGDLDLLGPDATGLLRRHGITWPYNLHFHAPIVRRARGGSLLVGADGDGLFDGWRWSRTAAIVARRRPLGLRDVPAFALAAAPRPLAAAYLAARDGERLDWLGPEAATEHARAWGRELAGEPRTWAARVRWHGDRRHIDLVRRSLDLLGAAEDCRVRLPLMEPLHLAALAAAGGRLGYRNRTDVLRRAYAGVLAPEVEQRTSKASFDPVFWGPRARAFAASWDGSGLDPRLVDEGALRREWARPDPHAASCHLLQAAWLASVEREERVDRPGE